jgi:serine phosphatase RsbU (regulator of sigma subunit)/anti-sigma regulatory factor (Ser/Thr protein kinase)
MLGYSRAELLARTAADIVCPQDEPRLRALLPELADGQHVTDVWHARRRDDSTIQIELSFRSTIEGHWQAIVRDVTQRQRAEAEREELLARERASNRRLTLIQQVTAALSAAATPTQVGEVILGYAAELGAAAVVVQRSNDHLEVLAHRGGYLPVLDHDDPLTRVLRTAEPAWEGARVAVPLVLSGRAIGALGLWFDGEVPVLTPEQRAAVGTLAAQCAQALDRARLHQAEHEVAEVLQRSLLPAALPDLPRLASSARYLPAATDSQAGGDWYDLLPVGESTVALAVGDVVGHGPSAAAVMGQLRSALAGYLLDGHPPAAALERLDLFAQRVDGAAGSTCACLTLDWSTGQLCWALAGHPPVLLVDAGGSARFLSGGAGTVLGVPRRPPYSQASTTIEPGASVVLFTDGLVERRDAVIDAGLERLASAARDAGDLDPDALAAALVATAHDGEGPADDVALVVVRLIPEPLRTRLPAGPRSLRTLRRAVAQWAARARLPDERTEDLQLALGEAAANAAEHAYRGGDGAYDCEVTLVADGRLEVRVRDYGSWRPVPADNGHRGHGLRLIGELAEEISVERGPDGTDVRFTLPRATTSDPTKGTLVG